MVLLLDDEGGILTANDRAADVYGYSLDELQGMNIQQLRATASRSAFTAEWKLARERGSLMFETVHQRRDGSEFAVEVSTRTIVVEGKTLQQSIIRDISDRKRAEKELSESESRFRQLVESSPYGILVLDRALILYANPEAVRMFGAVSAERPGRAFPAGASPPRGTREHDAPGARRGGGCVTRRWRSGATCG